MIRIIQGNALQIPLADQSVHCVVTSPPYWGLRDYGVEGQLGLEPTFDEYLGNMLRVFAEVHRVLRDDGCLFLNMGDGYFGSGKGLYGDGTSHGTEGAKQKTNAGSVGVGRAVACGISGREPANSPASGCLCGNLCGVCRAVYRSRTTHNDPLLVSMLRASLSWSNRERKESVCGHAPTSDSHGQHDHTSCASSDPLPAAIRGGEQLRAVLASTICESAPQLLDECLQRAGASLCLICARSLACDAPPNESSSACTCDIAKRLGASAARKSGMISSDSAYPYSSTASLKPKDLIGQPWALAFALRAAGWYLRSDIIWHKPAPMPESVSDRPTKAHEYLFLLTKRPTYFFDQAAWLEPVSGGAHDPGDRIAQANAKQAEPGTGTRNNRSMNAALLHLPAKRNRRSVWTIAPQPTPEAHFATFPEALVEPCLLAGCPKYTCPTCGQGWEPIEEKTRSFESGSGKSGNAPVGKNGADMQGGGETLDVRRGPTLTREIKGYAPACKCGEISNVPGTAFDPFSGSGTVCAVANRMGYNGIGLELNPAYIEIAKRRIFADVTPTPEEKAKGQRMVFA